MDTKEYMEWITNIKPTSIEEAISLQSEMYKNIHKVIDKTPDVVMRLIVQLLVPNNTPLCKIYLAVNCNPECPMHGGDFMGFCCPENEIWTHALLNGASKKTYHMLVDALNDRLKKVVG